VTVIGITFVALLGGSVLVESVFALPGLGSALATAAGQHDIPVVQGVVLYFTLVVVAVNLLVDLTYGILNPRVRSS
jgi:peptide/nickel transport system permease protein